MCFVMIMIRSTSKIWVVTRHHCGISAVVPQTLFSTETSGGVTNRRPFSQAKLKETILQHSMSVFAYFYIRYFIVIGNPIHSIEASSLFTLERNIKHFISKP